MTKSAKELLDDAKSLSARFHPTGKENMDEIRRQAKVLFDRRPESPCYRRHGDPIPEIAEKQLNDAVSFLAMLYAFSPNAPETSKALSILSTNTGTSTEAKKNDLLQDLRLLTLAAETHVRTLAAIAAGQIIEGDLLSEQAATTARAALREGMRFKFTGKSTRRPVYDWDSNLSRFDPDDDNRLIFQVSCPTCTKMGQFNVSALNATHAVTCSGCKNTFCVSIAYANELNATDHGVKITYRATIHLLGEGDRLVQFDDRNTSHHIVASREDLLAFVYSITKYLAAVDNLTTGVHHAVKY